MEDSAERRGEVENVKWHCRKCPMMNKDGERNWDGFVPRQWRNDYRSLEANSAHMDWVSLLGESARPMSPMSTSWSGIPI